MFVGVPIFFVAYERPTCSDNIRNQDEQAVDCGGSCNRLCPSAPIPLIVSWDRFFNAGGSTYNAVAVVESKNASFEAKDVEYEFSLLDAQGFSVAKRAGKIDIYANRVIPILETGIRVGESKPVRSIFKILAEPVWESSSVIFPDIRTLRTKIQYSGGNTRVTSVIKNLALSAIYNIKLVAILYDEEGNAVATSGTFVQALLPDEEEPIIFTWDLLPKEPTRVDIIPYLNLPAK